MCGLCHFSTASTIQVFTSVVSLKEENILCVTV